MDNRWPDNLRRKMETHTETPPEGLWEGVERGVERRAKAEVTRRRMVFGGIGSAAAAAVAVFVFMVGGGGGVFPDGPAEHAVPTVAQVSPDAGREVRPEPVSVSVPDGESLSPQVRTGESRGRARGVETAATGEAAASGENVTGTDAVAEAGIEAGSGATEKRETTPGGDGPEAEKRPANGTRRAAGYGRYPDTGVKRPALKSKSRRWQAGLYASNMQLQNLSRNESQKDLDFMAYPSSTTSSSPVTSDYNGGTLSLPIALGRTEAKHRMPVTVGVSVGYGLGERWSITSGVTYAMTSSRFVTSGMRGNNSREQVLHYVGVPVDVNYNLWETGELSVYLSAGGHAAKSVAGRMTYENGAGKSTTVSDRVQWSVRGSAGLGYDLSRTVGLYAEPGVDYHFDNGSDVETVYKAKPLNFGLRLGLRFSL